MAESSIFWTTGSTGDGASAYTMAQITDWLRRMFISDNAATQGVLYGYNNALAVSGTSSPVAVNTGAAVVYGFPYENTASVNVTVSTPTIGTTGHRVVLRASWSAQTVRIALLSASDGVATPPAVTQTAATTWEISLATLTITTGGVITVTDARSYCHFASVAATENLDADAVTNTVLRNSGALSVIGRAANSTGDPADISATAATDAVLRESGSALAFGTVATAGIANSAITDAKLRNSAALSVVGRAANSTGAVADISASAASGEVLRESGSALAFGTVATAGIADDAVTNDKIRNSGALSVIGRSANSTGGPADISAVAASDSVLRESGSTLGFGTIATAGIADDAVTTAKIAAAAVTATELATSVAGNGLAGGGGSALSVNVDASTIEINADTLRVKASGITDNELASNAVVTAKITNANVTTAKIANDAITFALLGDGAAKVYGRQGGDASDWTDTSSASNYTSLPDLIIQVGAAVITGTSGTITFPSAFAGKPLVFPTILNAVSIQTVQIYSVSTTQVTFYCSASGQTVFWLAIGAE